MKKQLVILVLLIVAVTACFGYIRRSMYELFTSGTCGPCVGANDMLDGWYPLHHDEVCLVRYHTSWPGSGDIFYAANPSQNGSRTSFYSVTGVPRAVLNGNSLSSWSGSDALALSEAGSYVGLEVELMPIDSGQVQVTVFCEEPTYSGTLDLVVVLIEDSLYYVAPNGQTDFYEVMRYMLPDYNGETITINGDTTLVFDYDFGPHLDIVDDYHNCWFVGFLQEHSPSPGDIVQCNKAHVDDMTEYGHFLDYGRTRELVDPADSTAFELVLTHFGTMDDNYDIWAESHLPAGWYLDVTIGGTTGDSAHVDLTSYEEIEIDLEISPVGDASSGYVDVIIAPVLDPDGEIDTIQFSVIAGGDLLYVASSAAAGDMDYYRDLFYDNGVSYAEWNQAQDGHLPDFSSVQFDAIVWHDGANATDGMDEVERPALRNYLNNGGKVFITSSGMGEALGSLTSFYLFILGALYQGTEYTPTLVSGSSYPGTEFSGFSGTLPGSGYDGEKFSVNDPAEAILRYSTGPSCGLKKDFTGDGKLVYVGFRLETITNETERDAFWDALIDYWGGFGVDERKLPLSETIVGAHPNPFNSAATIDIEMPFAAEVAVEAWDINGRMVERIFDGTLSAGENMLRWNAETRSSGVYWLRVSGSDIDTGTKVLLVK